MSNGFVPPSWMSLSSNDNFDKFVNNNVSLKIGQIIDINYPSEQNGFKTITYNVLVNEKTDSYNQYYLYNCQLSDKFGGLADYFTYTLRKNEKDIQGITKGTVEFTDLLGSYVLISLINGSAGTPIILGGLPFVNIPKESNRKVPTEEDGHHLKFLFNGVKIDINKHGELFIQRQGPTADNGGFAGKDASERNVIEEKANSFIKINQDGEIILSTTSKKDAESIIDNEKLEHSVVIDKDGKINIRINDGQTLEIKNNAEKTLMTIGSGEQSAAVAEQLKQLHAQMKQYIENATVATGFGPSGPIIGTAGPGPEWDSNIESKCLKIPK